jgi:hypothetical protein
VVQVDDVDARDAAAVRVDHVRREAGDHPRHRRPRQILPELDAVLPGLDRDRAVAVVQVLDARVADLLDQVRLRDPGTGKRGRGRRAETGKDDERDG